MQGILMGMAPARACRGEEERGWRSRRWKWLWGIGVCQRMDCFGVRVGAVEASYDD